MLKIAILSHSVHKHCCFTTFFAGLMKDTTIYLIDLSLTPRFLWFWTFLLILPMFVKPPLFIAAPATPVPRPKRWPPLLRAVPSPSVAWRKRRGTTEQAAHGT